MFCRETGTYEEEEDVEALDMGGMTATDIVLYDFRGFGEGTKLCFSEEEDFCDCCPKLSLPNASGPEIFALYLGLDEIDNRLCYLPHPVRPVVRGATFAGEMLSPPAKVKIRKGVRGKEKDSCLKTRQVVIRALEACAEAVCCVTMEGVRTDKGQTGHGQATDTGCERTARLACEREGRAETIATVRDRSIGDRLGEARMRNGLTLQRSVGRLVGGRYLNLSPSGPVDPQSG